MKKQKTYILSLEKDDPKKELEFEVAFQLSLTVKQRYKIMKKLFKQTTKMIKAHDYSKTTTIISRPLDNIISMKKAAGRTKDLADLEYLEEIKTQITKKKKQ